MANNNNNTFNYNYDFNDHDDDDNDRHDRYKGATVLDPKQSFYDTAISYGYYMEDTVSLYPSVIMKHNFSSLYPTLNISHFAFKANNKKLKLMLKNIGMKLDKRWKHIDQDLIDFVYKIKLVKWKTETKQTVKHIPSLFTIVKNSFKKQSSESLYYSILQINNLFIKDFSFMDLICEYSLRKCKNLYIKEEIKEKYICKFINAQFYYNKNTKQFQLLDKNPYTLYIL